MFLLDPNATLDFEFSWSPWLAAGETISAATVTADPGITVAPTGRPTTNTTTTVTAWLTGGTVGERYRITCRVTTTAGRVDDRTLTVLIADR